MFFFIETFPYTKNVKLGLFDKYKKKESNKWNETIERQERQVAREKYRRETEIYGDIFYDWDSISKETEAKLR